MSSNSMLAGLLSLALACGAVVFAVLKNSEPSEIEAIRAATAKKQLETEAASRETAAKQLNASHQATIEESSYSRRPLVVEPPAEAPAGMVWIRGGSFTMGNRNGANPDEQFEHTVELDGYWMDAHEVTNREYKMFVDATGFVTTAEKQPEITGLDAKVVDPKQLSIPDELNKPGSICRQSFQPGTQIDPKNTNAYTWWSYVVGANWKHPEGPGSTIRDRMDHPVVHVSRRDVLAYCTWAGKQLPTEAQWERAARGGREGRVYPWGNDRNPDGQWLHNIWQGSFPTTNSLADGFETTAPVGSFPANEFGLHDMSGNVWEWCADKYMPDYYRNSPLRNPPGPGGSMDPQEQHILVKYVQRGGSFMCSDEYCVGYRVSARMKGEPESGAFHTGFRCVINANRLDSYRKAAARQLDRVKP